MRRLLPFVVLVAALPVGSVILAACGSDAGSAADPEGGATLKGGASDAPRKDPVIPTTHPKIYMRADAKARLTAKLAASTSAAARFRSMVDDQIGGTDHYNFQPWHAALLGALGGDAKYCRYAVAQTDTWVAGEEKLIAAQKEPEVAGDSYLPIGDVIGGLAIVYDACFAMLSDTQKTRWTTYANQGVTNVWSPDDAKWGGAAHPWDGWSVDNPFNNYHYSFLRATMLLGLATSGDTPEASGFVDRFRKDKLAKLLAAFEKDLQGGGSREGTGYGVSHRELFEIYDFWEATTGERIWDLTGHTRTSLAYFMHSTVPTLDRIAPIGDQSRDSTAAFFDYHREQVLALQHLVGASEPLSDVAQTFLEQVSVKEMGQYFEFIWDFLYADPAHAKQPLTKLERTYYGAGTGMTFFRSSWAPDAMWGALSGGPYTESHAHHDQGSLLIYKSGWLGYDENVSTGSGIQQDEDLHNLVRLVQNGKTLRMQESKGPGQTVALADNGDVLHWTAKLEAVYGDPSVTRVEREVVFVKALETLVVFDRIEAGVTSSVWQLNAPAAPTSTAGKWTVAGEGGSGLEVFVLRPTGATTNVVSWPGVDADYKSGSRLDVSSSGHTRYLTVLGAKDHVASATGSEVGTSTVATLTFAGGASGTVSFSTDGAGGHITLNGGGVAIDADLGASITSIPVLTP